MKKETFCRYIRQYETDMFRFAKSIVGNQADGEDAMQESILKAYEKIDTLKSTRKGMIFFLRKPLFCGKL